MIDVNNDHLVDDCSNESCVDLAMLPPRENANALSDQDKDPFDDINKGLVYHLSRCLLNSACGSNILDRNCD